MNRAESTIVSIPPEDLVIPRPATIRVCRDTSGIFTVKGVTRAEFGHRIPIARDRRDDGIYGGWDWDGRCLRAWSDRYGMWPLFYAVDNDSISVSDSFVALTALLPQQRLDAEALAVFLRLGFFLGDDTAVASVRAFPPGGELRWDGALDLKRGRPVMRPSGLSFDQSVDAYIEAFRQSIARRRPLSGVPSLPLSGGRDSRHIALELRAQGCPVKEYVTIRRDDGQACTDIVGAQHLAAQLGTPHVVVRGVGPLLAWEDRKNLATHFGADEHAWIAPLFAYLARREGPSLDGIGGDVLSAGLFNSPHRSQLSSRGEFESLANDIVHQWSPSPSGIALLESLLGVDSSHDRVIERLVNSLIEVSGDPNPVAAFFFWNRTRREIALAPFGLGRAVRHDAPFLDHEVFDLLISLPPEWSFEGRLHDAALARAYGDRGARPHSGQYPVNIASQLRGWARDLVVWRIARRALHLVRHVPGRTVDPNHLFRRTLHAAQFQRLVTGDRAARELLIGLENVR